MPRLSTPLFCVLLLMPLAATGQGNLPTPAPELYKSAVANLNDGHWFEAAINDLTNAVKQEPKNSDYHLALGCAEVDRAGSLAYAAYWTDQLLNAQMQYANDMAGAKAIWQAAQQDPKADGYGHPLPIISAPPGAGLKFQTKDDLKYLRLTGRQAAARVIALGVAAQGEWLQAVKLAKTPTARAQAESVGGWGLLYERKLLEYTGYSERNVPHAPKSMDAVAAFRAAVKDDPRNATYWEGLGDAYPYQEPDDVSHAPDIVKAWQKSLALGPGNTGLSFRLWQVQSRTYHPGGSPDPKAALETMKNIAASDPGNSFLQYGLAAALFKQVHYNDVRDLAGPATGPQPTTKEEWAAWRDKIVQDIAAKDDPTSEQIASEAINAMERGNAGDHYFIPEYTPPVPKIVWHAWDYWHTMERLADPGFMVGAKLRELARAAGGYTVVAAHLGNEADAARAGRACIGMGMKMAGDWPIRDETPNDGTVIRVLVGIGIVGIGSSDLERAYQQTRNAAMAQATAAEYEAFKQKQKAHAAAVAKAATEDETAGQTDLFNSY